MNNDTIIKVDHVSKVYKLYQQPIDRLKEALNPLHKEYHKKFFALRDLSFTVRKGETIGIVGKNGSGKSTLLKLVTGVLVSTEGSLEVNGKISALLELGAGFNMEYTGEDNIYHNGLLMGYSREQMAEKINPIISFADIGEFLYQPVKTYSSGMFVRLAFAIAINVEPDILIVDEALAVGDTRFQLKCMNKFSELQQKGVTILFVSHDINAVKRFCNRTIWINNGAMIKEGDTNTICEEYMDFLKKELAAPLDESVKESLLKEDQYEVAQALKSIDVATVEKVKLLSEDGHEIDTVSFGQDIKFEVQYLVKEKNVINPVIGVAIYSIDNEYICGLNTLLDCVKISWNIGRNKCSIAYSKFNLTGGSYYFDVAIYDQTASVRIDYRTRILDFFVRADYKGEGIIILNHRWI